MIGGYEVVALLGAGGMGDVYRARDPHLGRYVAIKILPEEYAVNASRRARLGREARALASLNHPNVATLYGVEDTPSGQVLVMELVEGGTLADRLEPAGEGDGGPADARGHVDRAAGRRSARGRTRAWALSTVI